jgi:sRNA-binding carbon storage regulator CsrA
VVGLNVKIGIRLPRCLKFRNELKENLKENDSVLEKNLANATVDTKISFEYELRSEQ